MGRDTPLRGKKEKKIPCGKQKPYGPVHWNFWAILWSSDFRSFFFSYDSPILDFSLYSPRMFPPPHLCTLFSLAYSGVPDAGRDGVWIPAQTNADRTSAATGKIWSIA